MSARTKSSQAKKTTLPDSINDCRSRGSVASVEHGEPSVQEILKQLWISCARFMLSWKIVTLCTILHVLAIYTIYFKEELSVHDFGKIYLAQVDLFLLTVKESVWPGSDQYLFSKTLGPYLTKYGPVFKNAFNILATFSREKGMAFFVDNAHDLGLGVAHLMAGITYTFGFVLGKYPIALFFSYAWKRKVGNPICTAEACLLIYLLNASVFSFGIIEVIFLLYAAVGISADEFMFPTFLVQLLSRVTQAYWSYILLNFQSELIRFISYLDKYERAKPLKPWLLDFVRYMKSIFEDPGYWEYSKPKEVPVGVIFSSAVVAISIVLLIPKVIENLAWERKMTKYYKGIQGRIKRNEQKKKNEDITHDKDESSA